MKSLLARLLRPAPLLAASVAAGLVLLEILLRLFLPQPLAFDASAVWEPAPGVGWRRKANLDVRVNTGEREVRVRTDGAGHRIGATPAPEGGVRILAVGDSMVEALQVEHEQTFTSLLGAALSRKQGRLVEVVNAGLGGRDPNHYLVAVREELAAARYGLLLVCVYLENDVVERRVESFPPSSRFAPPRGGRGLGAVLSSARARVRALLRRRSHLYVFLDNYRVLLRTRSGARSSHFMANVLVSRRESPGWSLTADVLEDVAVASAREQTPALVALLPPHHYVDGEAWRTYLRVLGLADSEADAGQPARRLAAELERRGLAVVDMTPALKAAFDSGRRDLYGRIDRHLAPAGHEVVARALEPGVADALEARP